MRDFQLPGRSAVFAERGMCATSHPAAASTALDMLKAGGSAADAAVAAALVLGIAEPQMTGLGGDMFALVKPAGSDDVVTLNGSGRAPEGLSAAALRSAGHAAMPDHGAAVTLPGAVAGFCALLDRFGRTGRDRVFAPAIDYADAGLPVAPRVAFDWAAGLDVLQGCARHHYLVGGRPPAVGEVFRAPGQAAVLRRIASDGHAGFYTGEVAAEMVATLRAAGGEHTEADFASVRADWGEPVAGSYRGTELLEHAPNGHGATAILMGHILQNFDLAGLDPLGAPRAHLEAEAAKLAYDARDRFLADSDHTTRLAHMLDPATGAKLAALIDPRRALPDPARAAGPVHRDTVYVTVVDRDRMAVSLIYSIFHAFGSGIATPRSGILFHNRGAGFTLEPGHPNEAGPGKRPLHTIIPAMLRESGRVSLSFGVMGGAYQPNGHMRVLSNLRDYGMDPQTAIDAPRSFWDGTALQVERGYCDRLRAELAGMGHCVAIPHTPIGGAQAIRLAANGNLEGASDPRKDGCALGY